MRLDHKRMKEKQIVKLMIELYCKGHHHDCLCDECNELLTYANKRIDLCPFMESKTFCSNCTVHCYDKTMRKKMKQVMCYSGPRMLFYHPILAIKHVICSYQEKRKKRKKV